MNKGFTLWFTGLSGSGKTTISKSVEKALRERGLRVEVLDGDIVRKYLSWDLGFSKEDRDTNIKRATFVAKLLSRNGVATLVAFISPYRELRNWARKETTNFVEVYVKCPVEVCMERDVKGLYKKAMAGEIPNFTGVSDPYEEPLNPELVLETDKETPEESTKRVMNKLEELSLIPKPKDSAYSEEEEAVIEKRLKDLGYV